MMDDSLKFDATKLPSDTKKLAEEANLPDIDNFYLKLNKAARFDDNKFKFFQKDSKKPSFKIAANFSQVNFDKIKKEQKEIEGLSGYKVQTFTFTPDWRMVVGLGNESVYETSMTLHHIHGIPYIPGSALKGVVRSYLITSSLFKGKETLKEDAKKSALADKGFCEIFGCPKESALEKAHKGSVIFFDAFPQEINSSNITVDIMNPHYSPYYSGEGPPADYYNPIPIFFLTLQDVKFNIYLGVKTKDNQEIPTESKLINNKFELVKELQEERNIVKVAQFYLKKALEEHGIGAKTALGYGIAKIEGQENTEKKKKSKPAKKKRLNR